MIYEPSTKRHIQQAQRRFLFFFSHIRNKNPWAPQTPPFPCLFPTCPFVCFAYSHKHMRTLPTEDTDISFHLFIIVFIVLFICSKGINKIKKCILHTHRPPTSQEAHNSMPIKTAQNQKIWLPLVVFLYFSEMLPEKLKPKKHQQATKKHTLGVC